MAISKCPNCGSRMRVLKNYWICTQCSHKRHILEAR